MSDLTFIEKTKLERLFDMGGGYVLDFSNRTFQEFVADSVGLDIYTDKYEYMSGSKANRLRAFWANEPNQIVGKLINDLLDYCEEYKTSKGERALYQSCYQIAERLLQNTPVIELEAISPNTTGKDFELLAKSVKDSIKYNEPEAGLDRLHTFVVKYVRVLCEKHGIKTDKNKPLHSLFGEYVKFLKNNGIVQSTMAERILKNSISILEAFNDVRNNQSFAHDNPILNSSESLLIFNHVAGSIRFITELEESSEPAIEEIK